MPTLEEQIRSLDPIALRIFKTQVAERIKRGDTSFSRLVSMPELSDIFQPSALSMGKPPVERQTQETEQPEQWWQTPLRWMRNVETGAGTLLTAPFTPAVKGTENLPWWQREQAEYKAWQEPSFQVEPPFRLPWTPQEIRDKPWTIGVKGVVESVPWFATAIATGGLGGLGWAGAKTGISAISKVAKIGQTVLKPILAVEKAINYPVTKPLELVGKKVIAPVVKRLIPSELPNVARFVAPANEEIEKQITKMDWQRQVAQTFGRLPVLKDITEKVGGRAATVTAEVEDVTARALLIHPRVRETLLSKGQVALATLRQINPNPVRLFGIDESKQIATKIKPKPEFANASLHINDIAEHPQKYILSPEQSQYIKKVHEIEDWVLDGLKDSGVDVHELKFNEFSHWVHREVIGKDIDEAIMKIHKGGGRIGAKASWEKARFYEDAVEGVKNGILYEPSLERVVELYIQSASKRIADQRVAKAIESLGVKPLERAWERAPQIMQKAKETAITLGGAKQLSKLINRAIRGEKLPEASLKSMDRRFPEFGMKLRGAVADNDKLKILSQEAKALEESAKTPYWQARAERAQLMTQAKTPSLGTEAIIMHPAFQGKIYPKDVAGEISKYWDDMGWSPLNKLATMSGEMRTLTASADFSAMFIQGLPAIARHPIAWGKGTAMSFKAWANPQSYQNYLVKNLDTLMERANYGGYVGGFEFMEAMPQLQRTAGFVTGLAGKPALGKEVIRQTYGRFEASFGSFGDVVRNEMWKALRGRATNEQELMEIARHIDRMTGVMSQKALGIGKSQRAFEQAFLFFAPRYTRAGFALIGDLFKGGITGDETRKALGSMMAAGAAMYAGTAFALGQEPDFNPTSSKFMTIKIKDPITGDERHFGVGGMMYGLIRLAGDVGASIAGTGANEPLDFVKLNRFDNPFLKFIASKAAPMTNFMEGMVFGHNFFGEPFENVGDYTQFMAEQVLPISVQSALMEKGGLAPTAMVAQEAGLRTFPQSDWEERDLVRNRLSQQTYGVTWDELGQIKGKLYQDRLLRDNPELQKVTEKASETSSKMARGEGKIWDSWKKEGQAVEQRYREAITTASAEFEKTGDGTTFRNKVDEAESVKRAMYVMREKDPVYAEIQDYFKQPTEDISRMNPLDRARNEYYKFLYSPDMYDQFGNYNFDEADRRETFFVQKYGQQALDYIGEYAGAKWQEPNAVKMLKQARQLLQPYWDIENQIWSQFPQEVKQIADQISQLEKSDPSQAKQILFQYPQIVWARKMIALQRRQIKLSNPDIANALRMFYAD